MVTPEDREIIQQIEAMEEWLEGSVKHYLESGHICLAVLDQDVVAGFNLISLKKFSIPLLHFSRPLRPHEAFSEQISVNKLYRGKGLGTQIRQKVCQILYHKGIRKLYGATLLSNTASLRLAEKNGFRFIADIQYTKVLLFQWLRIVRVR